MKISAVMNFVRQKDQRYEDSSFMYDKTREELMLVNELNIKNTFLLQYDTICDQKYVDMFKNETTPKTELGLWYEIVRPLSETCGIPYNSANGWDWDYHIIPGFSLAYTPAEREKLIDEAMRKFREVFGYYPKTVASWLIDTHTVNYLTEHYDIDTLAICRDQVNTDAYTLVGGYFNGAYYPSKNNVFTPAQSEEMQNNTPVFRLLGPCPFHCYDMKKYCSENIGTCYTLEPVWTHDADVIDGMLNAYYKNEDLGFSFTQLGQENGFGPDMDITEVLRYQIDKLREMGDVELLTMSECGRAFKKRYPSSTPATSVVATENWDTVDAQTVYYDSKNYVANVFRYEKTVFIRALYLFDENIKDKYIVDTCHTFDGIYENLPIVDTVKWINESLTESGLVIDADGEAYKVEKIGDGILKIFWSDKYVVFKEDSIEIKTDRMVYNHLNAVPKIDIEGNAVNFDYEGNKYSLIAENAELKRIDGTNIEILPKGVCTFKFKQG